METLQVWNNFNDELYFFILKKVKSKDATNDIFQNTFLKIHRNLPNLDREEKVKAWIYQIARNEIANYFNEKSVYSNTLDVNKEVSSHKYQHICCFDRFINELPDIYKQVIEMIYIKGLKQKDAAVALGITLENVKIRIKRAKDILKKQFNECCKYEFDKNGKLVGDSNCSLCKSII